MPRVGVHAHARVVDLLAQLVATALLGQEAAAFIGRARAEEVHHEADQAGGGGRFQDDRVLARFQRLGFRGFGGLAHGDADVLVGLEVRRVLQVAADPARTAAVFGAHGAGVVEACAALVAEVAVAVGGGIEALAIFQEAGGDQAVATARRDGIGGDLGAEGRIDGCGGFAEGGAGAVGLLADGRHELRVFRGQAGQVLGAAHHAFQRGIVELVDRGGAHALAEGHGDGQLGVVHDATGGHVVQGETDVAVDGTGQYGGALIGPGQGDDLVEDGLGLGFGEDTHGVRAPDRSAEAACGVDDVDAVEARGGRAMRDRRDLARLALAVEE